LLDPTEAGRQRRLDFLYRSVDVAADLGADAVSFWSGTPDDGQSEATLWDRLTDGCRRLCDHAGRKGVRLAFEPEPGMFIDTLARYADLRRRVDHPGFGLTLDVGHLHCQGEVPIAGYVKQGSDRLWNVHVEDMRRGVHDHLMFGEGEIDFGPVLQALDAIGYAGGVHVELSRHSHDAVRTARRAIEFLRALR
jgi:L-ribulose-5-phosphate 3-epimerase